MNKQELNRIPQLIIRSLETAKEYIIRANNIPPSILTQQDNDFIIEGKDYFYSFENGELVSYHQKKLNAKELQEKNIKQSGKIK